ncbi:MAG: S28 family serine protease [Acidobacteriota bacterium]
MKPSRFAIWLLAAVLFWAFLPASCSHESSEPPDQTLLERLRALPGLQVTKIQTLSGYSESFQIDITQPIDHQNAAGGTFEQRFYLSHRSESAPTVFYTSGYGINRNFETELSALLQANQILMVHRFFPNADVADWNYLTIRQAADDQHRIRKVLAAIYTGTWVATGASKGGMTALYYRRFHPADVEATVAYVAPIMYVPDDPRFAPYFEQVGTAECRQKLKDFQTLVFSRRATLFPLFSQYTQSVGMAFNIISVDAAFEYAVLEYPFAFWQYGSESGCAAIPAADATDEQLLAHLVAVSSPSYYADSDFLYYQPLFYQAFTEIGYCPYVYEHVKDYLQAVPEPDYRAFAPQGVDLVFRPEVMQDVIPWLQNEGEKIIYIYGGIDPWSAAALEPAAGLDALKIVQPGANHGVRIMSLDQKDLVIQALERWLDIQIDTSVMKAWTAAPEKMRL